MYFAGTEMHVVVFIIILLQCIFFFVQILYLLARPKEQKRFWVLLLLFFTLYYNCVSGFLPDTHIPISVSIQNIIAYSGGVFLSMYIPFYIYKVYPLTQLRFFAYWGTIIFLFLPFLFCIGGYYILTGDLDSSRKLVVVIPFVYALSFIYYLQQAFRKTYSMSTCKRLKAEITGVYLSVGFWISLPIIVYFDGSQLLENSFANTGFIILFILYIAGFINDSKSEYSKLMSLEQQKKDQNIIFQNEFEKACKVYDLTKREIEIIHFLSENLTRKEIADKLSISTTTVDRHIANIYQKTEVSKKSDLLKKLSYVE